MIVREWSFYLWLCVCVTVNGVCTCGCLCVAVNGVCTCGCLCVTVNGFCTCGCVCYCEWILYLWLCMLLWMDFLPVVVCVTVNAFFTCVCFVCYSQLISLRFLKIHQLQSFIMDVHLSNCSTVVIMIIIRLLAAHPISNATHQCLMHVVSTCRQIFWRVNHFTLLSHRFSILTCVDQNYLQASHVMCSSDTCLHGLCTIVAQLTSTDCQSSAWHVSICCSGYDGLPSTGAAAACSTAQVAWIIMSRVYCVKSWSYVGSWRQCVPGVCGIRRVAVWCLFFCQLMYTFGCVAIVGVHLCAISLGCEVFFMHQSCICCMAATVCDYLSCVGYRNIITCPVLVTVVITCHVPVAVM